MFNFLKPAPSITQHELQNLLPKKITLLDVRSSAEFEDGHVPQAKLISQHQLENYQGPKDQPVYLICHSGARSSRATKLLEKQGYEAYNVQSGMMGWSGKIAKGRR